MAAALELANAGQVSLVDDADLAALRRWRWILLNGYAVRQQRTADGAALVYLHRFLMQARPWEVVDHDNRDPLDNRRANLVICSQSENLAKRPAPRAGQYRGVYFERRGGRWRAQISVGGRDRYLGTFDTPELAAQAYDVAAAAAFGRFARLNLPGLAAQPGPDPFDVPAPATRPDWYEIRQERRWRLAQAPEPGQFTGQVDNCGIEF